jgi:hypothetical protein
LERAPGIREDDGDLQSAVHPVASFSVLSESVLYRSKIGSDESGNIHYDEASWSSSSIVCSGMKKLTPQRDRA